MEIKEGVEDGWPYVEWVTLLASGKTVYSEANKSMMISSAVAIGIGTILGAIGGNAVFGFVWGIIAAGVVLTFQTIANSWGHEWEKVAKVTPVMARHSVRASLIVNNVSNIPTLFLKMV